MPAKYLRFRADISVHHVPRDGVFLLSGGRTTVLHGELIECLLPLLDGSHTRAGVSSRIADRFPPEVVRKQIDKLLRADLLVESDAVEATGETAHWERLGVGADEALRRTAGTPVRVDAVDGADGAPLIEALRAGGLAVGGRRAGLRVLVTDDLRHPDLTAADDDARRSGGPWCVVKLSGPTAFISPVLVPGTTACWCCATHHLAGRHLEASYVEHAAGGASRVREVPVGGSAVVRLTAGLAALRLAHWVAGVPDPDPQVVTFDTLLLRTEHHRLVRRPQCPACGDPGLVAARAHRPVVLTGGHAPGDGERSRSVPADRMLARYGHLVSRVTGIVTDLTPQDTGVASLHVYTAGHNWAVPGPGVRRKRTALRDRSAGKGTSSSEARAGALGEAIERYSAVWQGDEARVRSTWRALEHEGRRAVHPDSLQLYSARQYAGRDAWNSRTSAFHQVPVRFDENRACDWTPVWSLTGHHTVHVPTGALYYHYPHPPGQAFIRADSNGSAAGGTLEEAVLHGLLELIERDSVALWWYNRVQRPQVSAQGATADWQNEHARLGRRAWVLDLTSDLGVPVAAAVSCGTGHDPHPGEHILMGFGAGLDMRAAAAKAMNEANQLLAAADGSAPAGRAGVDPAVTDWWRTAALADHPYLAPLPEEHARAAARAPESGAEPPRDTDGLLQTMERHSLEVLVADQTRPDIGLPVVKVLVPGLRHFWPRYAPGRLYDVPVHLGWLAAPTAEEDLNPLGMFL